MNREKNMYVVGAINNYTAALQDSSSPCKLRWSYARFCVLIRQSFYVQKFRSITQKLSNCLNRMHEWRMVQLRQTTGRRAWCSCRTSWATSTDRTADLGGNTIIVHWYTNKTNLHKVPAYNTQLDASCMHGSSYPVILLFNNMFGFQVWDDKVIESSERPWTSFTRTT
jgi:hypothetical protein